MLRKVDGLFLVFVAIALVFILVASKTSFHWAKDMRNTSTSFSSGSTWVSNGEPNTASRFAIVALPAAGRERHMQKAVVEELRKELAKRSLTYSVDEASYSWSSRRPNVKVCADRDEALAFHPDTVICVGCKKWQYSIWPFSKSYTGKVSVRGVDPTSNGNWFAGPGSDTKDFPFSMAGLSARKNRFLSYSFDAGVNIEGKMTGLFSASHLTSSIAKSIAEKTAETIEEGVKERIEELIEDRKEEAESS
jgi:hypothetical protein